MATKSLPQRRHAPLKLRFARDSPLEGSGFEPSVPRQKDNAFRDSPQLPSSGIPGSLLTRC